VHSIEIITKIRRIARAINLESKKIYRDYGISIPQLLCLQFLRATDGYRRTQNEIKNYLNLNSSTASGIIDRLENQGLVARLPRGGGDKRVVHVVLTCKGDLLLAEVPELLTNKLGCLADDALFNIHDGLDKLIELLDIEPNAHDNEMPFQIQDNRSATSQMNEQIT